MRTKVLSTAERAKLYEEMRGTIVGIHLKMNHKLIGGGVFLVVSSSQLVLTAAHVVDNKNDMYLLTFDKQRFDFQVVHRDSERDVALLAVKDDEGEDVDDGFECAELCETNELTVGSEIHFIGHPGRQTFAYNIGNISCPEKTYDIFYGLSEIYDYRELKIEDMLDDFRGLSNSVKLVQAKNVHGGGRFGGTGAPFLDGNGNILGLYSFGFQDEDNAIHVADVKASIEDFKLKDKVK